MRSLVVSCVVVLGLCAAPRPAEARRGYFVVINTNDEIMHVRDLPDDVAPLGFHKLGYHYDRLGVFWLDLWRWSGEFVLYRGDEYIQLTPEQLDELGGASVPWSYRAPPGLLALLASIELAIVARRKRRAGNMIALGIGWLVVALILWLGGVELAFAVPGLLGMHHIIVSVLGMRLQARLDASEPRAAPPEPAAAPREPVAPRPPPPNVETDPFRAPPQPPPILVTRPSAPEATPVVADRDAEPPKLLR